MAGSFIQVAPDSTGKKMQTWANSISGDDVHAEGVVLIDQFGVPIVLETLIGAVNETAPASDTASSGLNGRLQRLAQRLTSVMRSNNLDPLGGDLAISITGSGPSAEPVLVQTGFQPELFSDIGANTAAIVKASAGDVFSISMFSDVATGPGCFLQLHNKATIPVTNDVPLYSFYAPPKVSQITVGTDFFTAHGKRFTTGIGWSYSIDRTKHVAGIAANQMSFVHWR